MGVVGSIYCSWLVEVFYFECGFFLDGWFVVVVDFDCMFQEGNEELFLFYSWCMFDEGMCIEVCCWFVQFCIQYLFYEEFCVYVVQVENVVMQQGCFVVLFVDVGCCVIFDVEGFVFCGLVVEQDVWVQVVWLLSFL